MLILIAGITGNYGRILVKVGLTKGHEIRGFGRSPDKLPSTISQRLESFVSCESYGDPKALAMAVEGVDAVICAYVGHAEAVLESQLALVRAVEKAHVQIYHALSWNSNWTKLQLGDFEVYDALISFHRHVQLTCSSLKPIYVYTGVFGEFAINTPYGIGSISKDEHGPPVLSHWADGDHKHDFTFMEDAASFSIDLITTNEDVCAGKGGYFQVHSAAWSAKDVARAYQDLLGQELKLKSLGSRGDLEEKIRTARATTEPSRFFNYVQYPAQWFNILGTWRLDHPTQVGGSDVLQRLLNSQMTLPDYYV